MRLKTQHLLGILIVVLWAMLSGCPRKDQNKTQTEPDVERIFRTEYDCQLSYNILSPQWRGERVQEAFDPANTTLDIVRDEETLTDSIVSWDDKGLYMSWHWTMTSYPDLRLYYKSYTISVWILDQIPEEPGEFTLAWAAGMGVEAEAMGMILTGRIRDLFSPPDSMEIKVLLHEWGHMRADLPHLCLPDGGPMDVDNHDQPDCLMAQSEVAQCTGEPIDQNMHFCGRCIENLKAVVW